MNKFSKMPITNVMFLLKLWDNPNIGFILAGPAAMRPTKSLYALGYLKPKEETKNPFKYGAHWTLDRDAFTEEDIMEMRTIYRSYLKIN